MIRGDNADPAQKPPIHAAQFGKLHVLAAKNGLVVQSASAPFLNLDELLLLTSLAQAQRVLGYRRVFHDDAMLTLTIVHCAGTLDALGIHKFGLVPVADLRAESVLANFTHGNMTWACGLAMPSAPIAEKLRGEERDSALALWQRRHAAILHPHYIWGRPYRNLRTQLSDERRFPMEPRDDSPRQMHCRTAVRNPDGAWRIEKAKPAVRGRHHPSSAWDPRRTSYMVSSSAWPIQSTPILSKPEHTPSMTMCRFNGMA